MKEELQQKLYERYPKLFVQKDLPMSVTNMCWGCCVGSGWYNILEAMCSAIQTYVDKRKEESDEFVQIEFEQVKEKFGRLRVYCNRYEPTVESYIAFAERLSGVTCEDCGAPGTLRNNGWIACRCDPCQQKYKEARGI